MTKLAGLRTARTARGISLLVRVTPRSSKKGIEGLHDASTLKVRLTASPVDNAANEQLIEILSDELGLPKSRIRITQGHTSRTKRVEIDGLAEV